MILSKKIRLKPTKEQEKMLYKSAGTARFIYNWTLAKQEENFPAVEAIPVALFLCLINP